MLGPRAVTVFRRIAVLGLTAALLVACAPAAGRAGARGATAPRSSSPAATVTSAASSTTTGLAPPSTTAPPTTASPRPATTARRAVTTTATATGAVIGQQLVVAAAGYGATTAAFSAYQETNSGWERVFGPWSAHLGYNGVAPPGAKREGDGRTPSGTYGFDFAFGVDGNPGVRIPYRLVSGPSIVWDDDPSSPSYNEWVDMARASAGANPEPMDQVPAYEYGVVIAYNQARTPGAGSAIFLHVSTGGATAGCVSLPAAELLLVLRWLDPHLHPTIRIGAG